MSLVGFFQRIIAVPSADKDRARRTFILHILLFGSIFLAFVAFVRNCILVFGSGNLYRSLTPPITFAFLVFLVFLFFLSKKGYTRLSAIIFIAFFFLSAFYTALQWGADVPQAWLMFALVITMSGILVNTHFALLVTFFISAGIIAVSLLQLYGFFHPTLDWKKEQYMLSDTIVRVATLVIIGTLSWLFNREIEKSLKRARNSEKALLRERNLLEKKVDERTKALKQAQLERITQLYRFAEIGKLSSSLFHDLVTPLSLITFNLESLKNKYQKESIDTMQSLVKRAIKGTKYLETFVISVRKQLQNQEAKRTFSLNKEIKQGIQMLVHKANSMKVKIVFQTAGDIKTYGNHIKFSQLMTNLILNAIDAYEDGALIGKKREIQISLHQEEGNMHLTVKDYGKGIEKENIKKIFQPFFTTKTIDKGTGIGLSISRDIVEKSFDGKISVTSDKKVGTVFAIIFPLLKKGKERDANYTLLTYNQ